MCGGVSAALIVFSLFPAGTVDQCVQVAGYDEEKCRVDMWKCLSSVIEGSLHYLDKPEGLMG